MLWGLIVDLSLVGRGSRKTYGLSRRFWMIRRWGVALGRETRRAVGL
jgi:hypothetical protein